MSSNNQDADSITVELRRPFAPFSVFKSTKALLKKNGTAILNYTSIAPGSSYYIVVKHRNSIETWSKQPVTMSSLTSFSFAD